MAYRFSNTDKWNDKWFYELKPLEKLLFIYLCDNCDIAGFIEVNIRRWKTDIDTDERNLEGALKGLQRGLVYSESGDCIYIRNYLKHQKNLPLNPNNKAHLGIMARFNNYAEKFHIDNITSFIEGASKGLLSPIGNGIGKGIGKDKSIINSNWKNNFEIYKTLLIEEFELLKKNKEWILEQEKYNPKIDIILSIEKSIKNYWILETGWKNKIRSKTETIDWKATFSNAISMSANKVYKQIQNFGITQNDIRYVPDHTDPNNQDKPF